MALTPLYVWTNKAEPFFVQQMTVAVSGRPAVVRTPVSNLIGKPMNILFRAVINTQIVTYGNTTDPFTMLSHRVIWAPGQSFNYQNEVLGQEADPYVTYGGVLDYYEGTMNLIIVG